MGPVGPPGRRSALFQQNSSCRGPHRPARPASPTEPQGCPGGHSPPGSGGGAPTHERRTGSVGLDGRVCTHCWAGSKVMGCSEGTSQPLPDRDCARETGIIHSVASRHVAGGGRQAGLPSAVRVCNQPAPLSGGPAYPPGAPCCFACIRERASLSIFRAIS